MEYNNYIFLLSLAFTAGFIDSVAGGGGLIQLPAMLILAPALPIPTIMGTNKFAAFSGTALATVRYVKQTEVPWRSVLPAVCTALIFSFLGARIVSSVNKDDLKVIILLMLAVVAIYTFLKKDFGIDHHPRLNPARTFAFSLATGMALGFYDGFFGPGTGSFLIVIFISVYGFNFLIASASAKLVNCATNISALSYFIYTGQVSYQLAIPVALFNMGGSWLGSRIAIKKGSAFVRTLFLLIVSAMILKFAWDVLIRYYKI